MFKTCPCNDMLTAGLMPCFLLIQLIPIEELGGGLLGLPSLMPPGFLRLSHFFSHCPHELRKHLTSHPLHFADDASKPGQQLMSDAAFHVACLMCPCAVAACLMSPCGLACLGSSDGLLFSHAHGALQRPHDMGDMRPHPPRLRPHVLLCLMRGTKFDRHAVKLIGPAKPHEVIKSSSINTKTNTNTNTSTNTNSNTNTNNKY